MATYRSQSSILQSVLEATKGTDPGAKTVRHVFETLKIMPQDKLYRPKLVIGSLLANQGGEFPISRGINWQVGGPVMMDQMHYYMGMVVNGTPVKTGTTPNWIWTATRNATADPLLKSRSLSYRLTDGTTPSDWKAAYAMATKLEVSAKENSPVMFSLEGFARRLIADGAFTAGLSLPTMDMPAMSNTAIYIDGSWMTPTTVVALAVLGWKFVIETGVNPLATADSRSDLDFSMDELNVEAVKTSVEIQLLAKAGGVWATEKTAAEAATLRQITILSTINANRSLQFRNLMKYSEGSIFPDSEKDGLQLITLKLEGSTDATNFLDMVCKSAATDLL
jgi:hypothetical protein